ncbi:MAG: LytR/AlgR family response regulator transcription factor [Pseudomonadota bacterium]
MTGKIRAILVDDEPLALRGLSLRLEKYEDVDIIATCRNGREAIKRIKAERPDLVFLDIQMPGLGGFDVIEGLLGGHMPLFIFVTAYDEFALKAFRAHAIDYLLKPVDDDLLENAVDAARQRLAEREAAAQGAALVKMLKQMGRASTLDPAALATAAPKPRYETRINIKDRGRVTCLEVERIAWIDAAGDYLCIHADGETHILRETMKTMERRLDPAKFQRVHRSTIVNLDKVKELHPYTNGECFLVLEGGGEVKVSRSYRSVVNRFM